MLVSSPHYLRITFSTECTSEQITNSRVFVPTLLAKETYSNVTGGQVVKAVKSGNETVFYSGRLQNSTITTVRLLSTYYLFTFYIFTFCIFIFYLSTL